MSSSIQIIYPSQVQAFNDIHRAFQEEHSYVALVAQMQSGKTDTFLLLAFEYIRLRLVDQVVLFTGNSDTALKQQTLYGVETFSYKYQLYLKQQHGIMFEDPMEWPNLFYGWRERISIVWSTELLKSKRVANRTLYIWEESHFAQSKSMIPFKYLTSLGIQAHGNDEAFRKCGNYLLSVSATPFSEYAAAILEHQEKSIVYLKPSEHYKGVGYFIANRMICSHENTVEDFQYAMTESERLFPSSFKYGLVRISQKQMSVFQHVARRIGWQCKEYNSDVQDIDDIQLRIAPTQNTIVFIKGALRMGQQLCKEHIGFCFETTINPNTDTILQSLMGRICSYSTNPEFSNIRIYLHRNFDETNEIEKYIGFIDALSSNNPLSLKHLPLLAMNIQSSKVGSKTKVIDVDNKCVYEPKPPVHIPYSVLMRDYKPSGHSGRRNEPLIASLSAILNDIQLHPSIAISPSAARVIESRLSEDISYHKCSMASYASKLRKLIHACKNKEPFRSSKCVDRIHIWKFDIPMPEYPEFVQGDIIIEYSHKLETEEPNESSYIRVDPKADFVNNDNDN